MNKELSMCIREDLKAEIIRQGTENFDQSVYRVSKWGTIEEKTFLNTCEEIQYETRKCKENRSEIGTFSTSCYTTLKRPKKFVKLLKKKLQELYPCPKVIVGHTLGGLSQQTILRIKDYPEKEHIDWWIYKDQIELVINDFKIDQEV